MPVGTIRVKPLGGLEQTVSGFGDVRLSGSLGVHSLFSRRLPVIRLRGSLALPSGTVTRVEDSNPEVPPNLVSIGAGVIAPGLELLVSQSIGTLFSIHGWLGAELPLTHNSANFRTGRSLTGGVGGLFRASDSLQATLDIVASDREKSRSRQVGEIVNSGGTTASARLGLRVRLGDKVFAGVGASVPSVSYTHLTLPTICSV